MKIAISTVSILTILLAMSCRQKETEPQAQNTEPQSTAPAAGMITGVVEEVLQATSYTYLKVKADDRDIWIAVTKQEIEVGATISFAAELDMKNFQSKDLQRTFDSVYFVSQISGAETAAPAPPEAPHRMKPLLEKQDISVESVEGGITIGQLFSDRDSYADKTVLIKGQVTKVNRAIMGKNWVHVQDGTSTDGKFDLTITTQENVNVGDVVTFEGKIVLNKDFGAGYTYDVLMENASLKTE